MPTDNNNIKAARNDSRDRSFLSSLMGGDNWIWGTYWILVFISIVVSASASSTLAYKQITNDNPLAKHTTYLLVGFIISTLLVQSLTRVKVSYAVLGGVLCYIGGMILMCLLPFFGHAHQGAAREIFGIQPVEILKTGTLILLCKLITIEDSTYSRFSWFKVHTQGRRFILLLVIVGLAALPIAIQNLSSALILIIAAFGIMFAAQLKPKYMWKTVFWGLVAGGAMLAALGGLHMINSDKPDHRTDLGRFLNRANTWESRIFDSGSDIPLYEQRIGDKNRQVIYAHMAIANSNATGRFIGESQLRDYLPEAYSDYVYCIIFEEMGVLGGMLVMSLYFLLFIRCYFLSKQTNDQLKRLLMIGLPLAIIVQALIHIGVCTDAMFVTGQPLPLISKGGMSAVMTTVIFGILAGLSHNIKREKEA